MTATLTAADQAHQWLADLEPEARFIPTDAGNTTAVLLAPHPMADDVSVRVAFTGGDRSAALAGARSELRALAVRAFTDPDRAGRAAADAREAYLFAPSPKGLARVRRALVARGHREPDRHEVQRAWLALKIDRGHDDHTVADVVDELLHQRVRLTLATRAARTQPVGQAVLL